MQVIYSTQDTQTLVPIVVEITDVVTTPELWVEPRSKQSQSESFTLPVKTSNKGFQSHFWLEQPGDYSVYVRSGNEEQSTLLHVRAHQFLPFGVEFGFFGLSLIFAFLGVYIWHKKKITLPKT
jgi:hypothetical protein